MKSRHRHIPFGENVDPSAFDYTLLHNLYIHEDGSDVIDFGDYATRRESSYEVRSLLKNRSFMASSTTYTAAAHPAATAVQGVAGGGSIAGASTGAALLHLHGDAASDDDNDSSHYGGGSGTAATALTVAAAEGQSRPQRPRRQVSRLISVEDASSHLWLLAQSSEERAPYARMFANPESLFAYMASRKMEVPVRGQRRRAGAGGDRLPSSSSAASLAQTLSPTRAGAEAELPFPLPQSRRDQGPLLTARWIDIQADPADPNARAMVRAVLSRFPVDEATIDNCLYPSPLDYADTSHLSSRAGGYAFFLLTCTPLQGLDYSAAPTARTRRMTRERPQHQFSRHAGLVGGDNGGGHNAAVDVEGERPRNKTVLNGNAVHTKGVMEMRLEAVRLDLPRSAVPAPVPVAVIAFEDWVITIHEKPFAEMDDLLRTVQMYCSPHHEEASPFGGPLNGGAAGAPGQATDMRTVAATASPIAQQRMTAAFIFTSLLQISIGHQIDSVALAQAVDELGDVVFDIKLTHQEQDKVLARITAVRRCFGECGADVTRCEQVVATLLQPSLSHNFLLREPGIREKLLNAQAHMRYVQHELNDCRDTVAVSNWYHNVALQWILLRRGNRALRQLLQLTEMANIMYPIITIQTLYSMNVPVPFDAEGDPPNHSLAPFFVLAAIICLYGLFCVHAVYKIMTKTRFETRLLA